MRTRIAVPLLCVVGLAVVLLVLPLLDSIASRRTGELELERRLAVERVTDLARAAIDDGDATALRRHVERYADVFGEGVLVVDSVGEVIAAAGGLEPDQDEVARRIRDFGYNLPDLDLATVLPWSGSTTLISTPVQSERDLATGAVVMRVDLGPARSDVRRAWALVVLPALGLLAALVLAVLWGTRWILRPVDELDAATRALASGGRPPDGVVTGPPELRRLARSVRAMAGTLSEAIDQQRDLVANTSHQLRNPLAAVRLHVDLLSHGSGAPVATVEALQRDLDRLDTTVDRLLGLAEAEHRATELRADRARQVADVGEADATSVRGGALLDDVTRRWRGVPGARVAVDGDRSVVLGVSRADAGEIADTLVDNAVKYAGRAARVLVSVAALEDAVALRVDDDGDGLGDDELHHVGTRFWRSSRHADQPGTGLGLALVDALARANGGVMDVGRSPLGGLRVEVRLPGGAA